MRPLRFGRVAALDFEAHPDAGVPCKLNGVLGRRDAQTHEVLPEPTAGVQFRQLVHLPAPLTGP